MPKHKTLKSVARSVVESFTGLTNWVEDDYVMGHIVCAAWSTGGTELRVDLLTGRTERSPLLTPAVGRSISGVVECFPDLVKRSGSDPGFVAEAELKITVDPSIRRGTRPASFEESPFTCSCRLVDDRGKSYSHSEEGWWWPEQRPPEPEA